MTYSWNYTHITTIDTIRMSGWKLYIYGEDENDASWVNMLVTPICRRYNITIKVANSSIIERNKLLCPAWGIAVLYLHSELFIDQSTIPSLIKDISLALTHYDKKGVYSGARGLNDVISCRYDLNIPVIPHIGLSYSAYLQHYRGEFGEYNIPHNNDPFIRISSDL